ncbi:hypothetical protein H9P43_001827 [Blastocladiella emersonii ATCC 22665]|nr:hypothetical protein H9P43_001827 [Blastocladiella emersonii ATCC 22665]
MQTNGNLLSIFDLPVDVQERVAAHLDDAYALRLTSRAALDSSLWHSKPWWPAVFALVGGDTNKFRAAIPAYFGRLKGARAAKKREKKKQLFFELARALVCANVGEGKSWAALRDWAGGELPIDAAGYFAIIRAGLHVESDDDFDYDEPEHEEEEEEEDADAYDVDEVDEESPSAKADRRESPTSPESKHSIAALTVVLQWKTRKGGLLYASYAEQTKTTFESQPPPIAPVLASPLISSPVRRDLLRAHCRAKFYGERPGELVPAMLLEGTNFVLEILCLSLRRICGRVDALHARVESFLEHLILHAFGSEEHFHTMRLVHDILVAATSKLFRPYGPPMAYPVDLVSKADVAAAVGRGYERIKQVRRELLPAGTQDDDQYDETLPIHVDLHEILTGASQIEYERMFSRAFMLAVARYAPRASEALRAWVCELRFWKPSISLWTVIVTMLRKNGPADVAAEAEPLFPIAEHEEEPIMLLFNIGSEMVVRSTPYSSLAELRKAYEVAARAPRRGRYI